jgi:hypothetical protein
MDDYKLAFPHLKATKHTITLGEIWARSLIKKREVISPSRRSKRLSSKQIADHPDQRIAFFKSELSKKRVSFMEDSITLVIDRNNIVEQTLAQIDSIDRFSYHKEIKIFFVGEEAQDAGGVLKEWIFELSK